MNFLSNMKLILCLHNFLLHFFTFSLLKNHNKNLCNDRNIKMNVLQQPVAPRIVFKISGTKAK